MRGGWRMQGRCLLFGLLAVPVLSALTCGATPGGCGHVVAVHGERGNVGYWANVTLPQGGGTLPITGAPSPSRSAFGVQLDTGSSNFAVAGRKLASPVVPGLERTFECAAPSCVPEPGGATVTITYGSGSISGDEVRTDVRFDDRDGGEDVPLNFIAIDKQTSFFTSPQITQGIAGLAYQTIAQPNGAPQATLLQQLRATGYMERDIFGLTMCGEIEEGASRLEQVLGSLVLGGVHGFAGQGAVADATALQFYDGPLFWTPLVQKAWYTVPLVGMSIGGVSVMGATGTCGALNPTSAGAIVDSGTTDLVLPTAIFNAVVKKMEPAIIAALSITDTSNSLRKCFLTEGCSLQATKNFVKFPWDEVFGKFPVIEIDLAYLGEGMAPSTANGTAASTSSEAFRLHIGPVDYLRPVQGRFGVSYIFGLAPSSAGGNLILGDVVMEGYHTVFDRENLRVGFGRASTCKRGDRKAVPVRNITGPFVLSTAGAAAADATWCSCIDTSALGWGEECACGETGCNKCPCDNADTGTGSSKACPLSLGPVGCINDTTTQLLLAAVALLAFAVCYFVASTPRPARRGGGGAGRGSVELREVGSAPASNPMSTNVGGVTQEAPGTDARNGANSA